MHFSNTQMDVQRDNLPPRPPSDNDSKVSSWAFVQKASIRVVY